MENKSFPHSLQDLPVWTVWQRNTKIPYSALYDGRAKSNDPSTWSVFEKAWKKYSEHPEQYGGVGLAISKQYRLVFIDLDHCIKDGIISEEAAEILELCRDQYVEISQSGTGIHILVLGDLEKGFKNSRAGVEMYCENRFCAMTGSTITNSEPHEDQALIDYILAKYKRAEKAAPGPAAIPEKRLLKTDREIVKHAEEGNRKFSLLYSGQWNAAGYSSQSEADLALCGILAFWSDNDPDTIDRLFRSSGLNRPKWEARRDYRESTIEKARSGIKETYSQYLARKMAEEGRRRERAFLEEW